MLTQKTVTHCLQGQGTEAAKPGLIAMDAMTGSGRNNRSGRFRVAWGVMVFVCLIFGSITTKAQTSCSSTPIIYLPTPVCGATGSTFFVNPTIDISDDFYNFSWSPSTGVVPAMGTGIATTTFTMPATCTTYELTATTLSTVNEFPDGNFSTGTIPAGWSTGYDNLCDFVIDLGCYGICTDPYLSSLSSCVTACSCYIEPPICSFTAPYPSTNMMVVNLWDFGMTTMPNILSGSLILCRNSMYHFSFMAANYQDNSPSPSANFFVVINGTTYGPFTYPDGCGIWYPISFDFYPAGYGGTGTASNTIAIWASYWDGSTLLNGSVAIDNIAVQRINSTTTTASFTACPNDIDVITGTTGICIGATTILSDATAGGTWSSSNTAIATVNASTGVVTGVSAGAATISYRVNTCAVTSTTVEVYSAPVAGTISGSDAVCVAANTPLTLTGGTAGGTWSSSNTSIATVTAATGVVTGVAGGTVTITYTVANPCGTVFSIFPMMVEYLPSITGATSVCTGHTITLSDATGGGTWSSSNTAIATVSTDGVVTGVSAGTATIDYAAGACIVSTDINVNTAPYSITGAAIICGLSTTTLDDATAGGTWSSSNTAVGTVSYWAYDAEVVHALSYGSTTISYTLSTGCAATLLVDVNPVPDAIGYSTIYVCQGSTITFTDATAGGTWSSYAGTIASITGAGIITGVTGGSSTTISYTVGGCSVTAPIIVHPLPSTTITTSGSATICEGGSVTLTAGTGVFYQWYRDGYIMTGETGASYVATTAGTYTVKITSSYGCIVSSDPVTVVVNPLPPTPVITPSGPTTFCAGGSVVLSASPSSGYTYKWYNSAGLIVGATLPTYTAITSDNYTVVIANSFGCTSTSAAITVVVNPIPNILTGPHEVCIGAGGTFTDDIGGGTWTYTGPTGLAAINPVTGVFTTNIAYPLTTLAVINITYTDPAGCTSAPWPVQVDPMPPPITGPTWVCVGTTIALADLMGPGTWYTDGSGDVTIGSTTGIVTGYIPTGTGTTLITYTVLMCSITDPIIVYPQPNPNPISGINTMCVGSTTTLTDGGDPGGTWGIVGLPGVAHVSGIVSPSSVAVTGDAVGSTAITYSATNICGTISSPPYPINVVQYPASLGSCICDYTMQADAPFQAIDAGGSGTTGSLIPGYYYLDHNITINSGSTVYFPGCIIIIGPGVSITVMSGAKLSILGSHLFCCKPNMWQGITLTTAATGSGYGPTGQLEIAGGPGNTDNSLIEDAYVAVAMRGVIEMPGYTGGASTGLLTLYSHGAAFNKNIVGISIDVYNAPITPFGITPDALNPSYPFVIENTIITARTLDVYTNYPLSWPSNGSLKTPYAMPTHYDVPYSIDNTALNYNYTLCNNGTSSQMGIYLREVGYTAGPVGSEAYSGIVTGGAYSADNTQVAADMNLIDYMAWGIYAVNSNVVSRNTAYTHMYQVNAMAGSGAGINASRNSSGAAGHGRYKLDVYGDYHISTVTEPYYLDGYNNKFWDCNTGVWTDDLYNVRGIYSLMYSRHHSSAMGDLQGVFGYHINSTYFYNVQMDHNNIINVQTGIYYMNQPPHPGENQVGQVSANHNQVWATYDGATPIAAGEYVYMGISLQNLAPLANAVDLSQVNADYNTMNQVYNGIYVVGPFFNNHILTTDYNNLNLAWDNATGWSATAKQIGIEHANIKFGYIDGNTITGPGYNSPPKVGALTYGLPIIEGIHIAQVQFHWTECNNITDINAGTFYDGSSSGENWISNTYTSNYYGYALHGSIGNQPGDVATPYLTAGNQWTPGTVNWQTYVVTGSMPPAGSYMNVQSPATQNPSSNGYDVGVLWYIIGAGINIASSPNMPCLDPTAPVITYARTTSGGGTTAYDPGYYIEAAMISLPILTNTNNKDWMAQLAMWGAMQADTSMDTIPVLHSFRLMAQNCRYKWITDIESSIGGSDYAGAGTLLAYNIDSLSRIDSDVATGAVLADGTIADGVVSNYLNYYKLLIKYKTDTLNPSDSILLGTLAHKCPSVDGAIIHDARGLYSLVYNVSMRNDLGCDSIDGGGGDRRANNPRQTVEKGKQQYSFYPNPNDGNFTLQQLLHDTTPIGYEIWNSIGVNIDKGQLIFTNGSVNMSVKNVVPGLYLLHLKDDQGYIFTQTFIINKL